MACYNHVEKTEICTCTYCGKHLCQDCHKKIKDCLVCKTGDCSTKIDDKSAVHKNDHCHQSLCVRYVPYLVESEEFIYCEEMKLKGCVDPFELSKYRVS